MSTQWRTTCAEIARIKKADPHADVSGLRRRMHAELLEEKIRKLVEQAPPLSPVQVRRIAALLKPGPRERAS